MSGLSKAQIQQIFDFTAQKYIKYYDVQLELVDHIANRIEEMQAVDHKLSFESALQRVYKSFGIYGFTKVQEQKVTQMERYWMKRFGSYYLSYFRLPKVLLLLALSILFYFYLDLLGLFVANGLGWYITLLAILIICTINNHQIRKKNAKQIKSQYLIIHAYGSTIQGLFAGGTIFSSSIGNVLMTDGSYGPLPFGAMILASVVLSAVIINHHAISYVFPQRLQEEVHEKYGHLERSLERPIIV